MLLYGSSMSPFVRKVLVVCAEKGIAIESRAVGIGSMDEGFRAASPFGKMPALVDGDYMLADSSAIVHYLEAIHRDVALIPEEARSRGKVIWFEEFADTILAPCVGKMFFNRVVSPIFLKREGDANLADRAEAEELPSILRYLEGELQSRRFLVGDRLTLADVAVASCLANLEHAGVAIEGAAFPNLRGYTARLLTRHSFATILDRERSYFAKIRSQERVDTRS